MSGSDWWVQLPTDESWHHIATCPDGVFLDGVKAEAFPADEYDGAVMADRPVLFFPRPLSIGEVRYHYRGR